MTGLIAWLSVGTLLLVTRRWQWPAASITLIVAGGGIRWSVHLWTGAIVLSGITGLLVSMLLLLPAWLQAPLLEQTAPQVGA